MKNLALLLFLIIPISTYGMQLPLVHNGKYRTENISPSLTLDLSKEEKVLLAVFKRDIKRIKILLRLGANPTFQLQRDINAEGLILWAHETAPTFWYAVESGNLEMIQAFLNAHVDPNFADANRIPEITPPLHTASRANNFQLCTLLLKAGADVNMSDRATEYSALMSACCANRIEIARLFIKAGANLFHINLSGWPILETIVRKANQHNSFEILTEIDTSAERAEKYKDISCLLIDKMLSILSPEQKARIYAFLICIKHACAKRCPNLKELFKKHLVTIMKEENQPMVNRTLIGLSEGLLTDFLMKKYFVQMKDSHV